MLFFPAGWRRCVEPRSAKVWYEHIETGLAFNHPQEVMAEEARRSAAQAAQRRQQQRARRQEEEWRRQAKAHAQAA
eukprot:758347-Alexandrium_andersonii.AAC.1